MGKLKLIILLVFISTSALLFAQDIQSNIIEPLQKDALFREKVFIHLNKTTYLANETIWFTAYVNEDASDRYATFTTNLNINLLNQKGDVIQSKTIFIKNGVGFGNFLIEDLRSGKYFIQASTDFMRNFGKENVYIQEIKIISSTNKEIMEYAQKELKYDIQVFPESGYLLEDTENTIGIKALINGKSSVYKGKIIDSKGVEITTFHANRFGMSKCHFFYDSNESYVAQLTFDKITKKIKIPKAHETGIIFSIDSTDPKYLKLTIKTNKESLPSLRSDHLALLTYRNNYISNALNLSISDEEQTSQDLFFEKEKFLNGVNVVTLFRNNQPIGERKFFIEKQTKTGSLLVEKGKITNDSIQYTIKTFDHNYQPIATQLSVSVLSKDTKVFEEKQNIKSAFLLTPYVKGHIENPSYYFNNKNSKEKENLDLLLLNQGWTAYSFEEFTAVLNPKKQFAAVHGFTIKGHLKKHLKGYDIGILSKKNRLTTFSTINENNQFTFENIFAYKNDTARVALIKKGKGLVKPNNATFHDSKKSPIDFNFLTTKFSTTKILENSITTAMTNEKDVVAFDKLPKVGEIGEVVLKNVKLKKEESNFEKELNIAAKRKVLSPGFYRTKKVTEEMEQTYKNVYEYFQSKGYIKTTQSGSNYISLRNTPQTIIAKNKNPDASLPPTLFIDNVQIYFSTVFMPKDNPFEYLNMENIDEIIVNKTGAGGGVNGMGGIIRIYTKKGDHEYYQESTKNLYESLLLLTGFDKATAYYKPLYNIYSKETLDWTDIDWYPNLETTINGELTIKVPTNEYSNNFQLIINGFSENGLLFHDIYKSEYSDF